SEDPFVGTERWRSRRPRGSWDGQGLGQGRGEGRDKQIEGGPGRPTQASLPSCTLPAGVAETSVHVCVRLACLAVELAPPLSPASDGSSGTDGHHEGAGVTRAPGTSNTAAEVPCAVLVVNAAELEGSESISMESWDVGSRSPRRGGVRAEMKGEMTRQRVLQLAFESLAVAR
ncbi:unnamed protein product, partial [Discosporangium mesarthrocarpum]